MGSPMYGERVGPGGRRRAKPAASSPPSCPGTKTIPGGWRCRCDCSAGCTGWRSTAAPRRLRRWYPSTGGQWDAEAAWPDIALAASDHADHAARRPRSAAANQRGGSVRRADRWSAHSRSPIRFACPAFRDRVQCRAEPAGRLLPLSLSGRPVGSDRLTGDHRRRVARPTAARRGPADRASVMATTSRRSTPPAATGN